MRRMRQVFRKHTGEATAWLFGYSLWLEPFGIGLVDLHEVLKGLHAAVGEGHDGVIVWPVDPDQSVFLVHLG